MSAAEIEAELGAIADPERATHSQRYFKTGPGEYGEGDVFLGVGLTGIRAVARRHRDAAPADVERLLASEFHEHRQCGLIILTLQAKRADEGERARIARFYLDHLDAVDNWDLVDVSAPVVLADEVRFRPRELLDPLLASERLWDRRVAVLATFSLIREGSFEEALNCCERLLGDRRGPDPQGDRLDAPRGRQARPVGPRALPGPARGRDAADNASLRDRAPAAGAAGALHGALRSFAEAAGDGRYARRHRRVT